MASHGVYLFYWQKYGKHEVTAFYIGFKLRIEVKTDSKIPSLSLGSLFIPLTSNGGGGLNESHNA